MRAAFGRGDPPSPASGRKPAGPLSGLSRARPAIPMATATIAADGVLCGRATSDDFAARPSHPGRTLGRKHRRRWQPRGARRQKTASTSPSRPDLKPSIVGCHPGSEPVRRRSLFRGFFASSLA
jgi:hypothetical protein